MTIVIDALASANGVNDIEYELLTRVEVSVGLKNTKRMISSRPKAVNKEHDAVLRYAYYLGTLAASTGDDISIYFHDADRTNSGSEQTARLIERAMMAGFELSHFARGVPMVPNPRSESWLLAYFQNGLSGQREYNKAKRFEDLPGNDSSPKSAKKLLQEALGAESVSDIYTIVMERIGEIDWTRVYMPSYNRFRDRLETVLKDVGVSQRSGVLCDGGVA